MAQIVGEFLDRLIEPFAPRAVRRRLGERQALDVMRRQYDAGANGRRTGGWKRTSSSADREVRQGLVGARNAARELVRNNKYAASAVRQVTAHTIGDGIAARATHADPLIAARAQAEWDRWAESAVDGRDDFYGIQKTAFRATVEGGEAVALWGPDKAGGGPNGRVRVVEGDLLDQMKEAAGNASGGGRIVQGVEFDSDGDRAGYWMLPGHPGDLGGRAAQAKRFAAEHVDHVFELLRPGQTRGISWLAPFALDLRDSGDYQDAVLMKRKVEACVALVITPGQGETGSPLGQQTQQADGRPSIERLAPGMIYRTGPGETATSVNPTSGGDGIDFVRMLLAGVSANLAPYHLITGDVSQANYSSLRAAMLGFWANLDDWQQNMMIPYLCNPAFRRRMARLALDTGDLRYLEVRPVWAPPLRRFVDPLKDVAGEIAEIRAGLKTISQSLSERGISWEPHMEQIKAANDLIDKLGLALETDPRRVTASGILQAAAGYLTPKGELADAA